MITDNLFIYEYLCLNKTLKEISKELNFSLSSLNKKAHKLKIKKTSDQKYYSKLLGHSNFRELGLVYPEDIKKAVYFEYITKNKRLEEVSKFFKISKISFERLLRKLKIKKHRLKYQELIKETCVEKYGKESALSSTRVRDKIKKTNIDKYGFENAAKNDKVKEKIKKTNISRYGVEYCQQSPDIRKKKENTCLVKYKTAHSFLNEDIRKKIDSTNITKLGCIKPFQSLEIQQKIKNTNFKNIGVPYPTCHKDFFKKSLIKKRERGTFNKSNSEEKIYQILSQIFEGFEIKRQYSEKRYPFSCDFYVPHLDLFIEFQGHWAHGKEPYKGTIPELWKLKAETSKYYKNAIRVYSQTDPKKRSWATANKLKYIEIWNNDFKKGPEELVRIIKEYINKFKP